MTTQCLNLQTDESATLTESDCTHEIYTERIHRFFFIYHPKWRTYLMPELISNNHFNLPNTPKTKSLSTVIANTIENDRQIILFPNGFNSRNLAQFKQAFSITNIAHICDFRDTSWSTNKTEGAQLLVFDRLGVGLLSIDDPQQFRNLKNNTQKNHALRIVRPELQMQLALSPDSESLPCDEWNAPLENFPPNQTPLTSSQRSVTNSRLLKGYEDNQKHSWAMQACGITQLRWTGKGVKIAILDTGLDFNHMDWCSRQITHRSFIDNSTHDFHGHGTQCAGLAAGFSTDPYVPRFSAAPMADLHIAKVLNPDGSGPDSAILAGIDWALGQGCQLLSLSVGIQMSDAKPDPVYEHVARRCLKSGMLFMAAAGNDSQRPGLIRPVCRPASSPSVFAVGAVDRFLRLANFTNGSFLNTKAQIDAVAPGVDVFTTSIGPKPYGRFSGTSMAAPLCAGLAALLVQDDPDCLGGLLWQRLASLAKRLPLFSTDVGMGLVTLPSIRTRGMS